MQAVILAAGKGTRMKRLTVGTPKPMLELNGRPLLDYKIRYLPDSISEVILVVGHNKEIIESYFGSSFGNRVIKYVYQYELNGTAGALYAAQDVLNEKFMVLMGDDLYDKKDLESMLEYELAVLGFPISTPVSMGVLQFNVRGDLIDIIEKSRSKIGDLANTGAYVIRKDFFSYTPVALASGEYGLPQTLLQMKDVHSIAVLKASRWLPVGTPEQLASAEKAMKDYYPNG